MSSRQSRSKSPDDGRVTLLVRTGLAVLGCALAASATGDESSVKLKPAPEETLVRAQCSACHSVDYIVMNSPFLTRAAWEAEVRKMMKVMGAPIPEQDVAPLVDYLTKNYGSD
jgi:hypothetical protein